MNADVVRREEGQALVIVALAMFVLIGSIALSVDWGHSLLTRRGAQNEADAAALGAGRYLVSSHSWVDPPLSMCPVKRCGAKRADNGTWPRARPQTRSREP